MTGSAVVAVNARPTALVSGSTTICNGQSATITAVLSGSGPWDVTWSDGVTQSGVSASPATRTVNPVVTRSSRETRVLCGGCKDVGGSDLGSAVVAVNARPTALVSGSTTICNGQSATITAVLGWEERRVGKEGRARGGPGH